jgi:hypothetical protein
MFTLTAPHLIYTLFSIVFTSQLIIKQVHYAARLTFVPSLYKALSTFLLFTIDFFKSSLSTTEKRWAVYVNVLGKHGCRPKIYVGSSTDKISGGARPFQLVRRQLCPTGQSPQGSKQLLRYYAQRLTLLDAFNTSSCQYFCPLYINGST